MRRNDADKRGGYDNSDMKTSRTDLYNAIELVPVRNTNPGVLLVCFFFQAEDGIRDKLVTGVQTCALPICRDPAAGDDALLPAVPVRRGEGLRTLDHGELPRVLWALRRKWHPLQPRVAPAGARVRHPQGEPRRGADREGEGERAAARQPRRPARLGLCGGLRRGHVAHAAAARARGLRRGDGTAAHRARAVRGGVRPRWARLASVREGRPAVRAAGGGGYLAGRRVQGAPPARLGAAGELRGARAHDGERGPGAGGVKVLVTGADGFVGRWMVRRLIDDGREVYAAVRPAAPAGPPAGPAELSAAERAAESSALAAGVQLRGAWALVGDRGPGGGGVRVLAAGGGGCGGGGMGRGRVKEGGGGSAAAGPGAPGGPPAGPAELSAAERAAESSAGPA